MIIPSPSRTRAFFELVCGHCLVLFVLSLLMLTGCGDREAASTQRVVREPKRYTIEQFMKTVNVSAAGISHDNGMVLFTSDESGIPNVYAVPFDGSPAKALTQSTDSTYAVSWFPNDQRFLYRRDQGGNELYHLYVGDGSGNAKDLTPGDKHRALFMGWSEDKSAFFVATNERNPSFMDIYRYNVDTYARELHYQNPGGYDLAGLGFSLVGASACSPSGKFVVLSKSITTADNNLYLVETSSDSDPKLMTPHEGVAHYGLASFSPDERSIFLTSDEGSEFQQVFEYVIDSGTLTKVDSRDWDVMAYTFSENGKYRVQVANEDSDTVLEVTETNSGKQLNFDALERMGRVLGIQFSQDETRAVVTVGSDRSPRNLVSYELETGKPVALTRTLNPEIDKEDLVESQVVRFQASDGMEIPGPLWVPHQAGAGSKAPALVWVHGGPGGQTRRGYSSSIQYLVNAGYVVFGINNRGSSGYGKTFFASDDQRHGKEPLRDCVEARAFLASMREVDPDRIGIIGGSYGGYMVLAALAFHPEAFDVGVNIFGVANWLRTLQTIPPWWEAQRAALYAEMGDPVAQEEMLREISPLFHADRIERPLMVLQGANDPRVLQVESDEIVEKVREKGGVVEYVLFPDEGHGFSKKKNQIEAWEAIRNFLDRYLKQTKETQG